MLPSALGISKPKIQCFGIVMAFVTRCFASPASFLLMTVSATFFLCQRTPRRARRRGCFCHDLGSRTELGNHGRCDSLRRTWKPNEAAIFRGCESGVSNKNRFSLMDWEAISKIGTANHAIAVIGFILYEQTQALHALAENISVLVKVYSGHLSPISTN